MKLPPVKVMDQYDGKPLLRYWKPNTFLKPGEKVLAQRPRPADSIRVMPQWTHDVWTGDFEGYGRDEKGQRLFRSMKNAVRFATAAYAAGYRMKSVR